MTRPPGPDAAPAPPATPAEKGGLPIVPFADATAWEAWLESNHATSRGLWVQLAKKDSGIASVTYAAALDVALCYGWIDGQKGALDARYWLQKFTPRGRASRWSKINRERALALKREGRMRPTGLAEMERARADGRWEAAYASQRAATVPDDLQAALDQNPEAKAFFGTLNSPNRYAILYRLQDAKRPETRARRLAQFVEMLNEKRKIYP
jgi:uncharacterized protein YdeI (YjbR/CyaY-like superfamily)